MTSSKKRFGISIPADVADQLEMTVNSTGSDRSSIVAKALEQYLHEDIHKDVEHSCSGIIICYGVFLPDAIRSEHYFKVVKTTCTVNLSGGQVTVLFVEGSFKDINALRKSIVRKSRKPLITRYIPLYCSLEGRKH
jgi:CopG family nickel-responsive transcriptional regulator